MSRSCVLLVPLSLVYFLTYVISILYLFRPSILFSVFLTLSLSLVVLVHPSPFFFSLSLPLSVLSVYRMWSSSLSLCLCSLPLSLSLSLPLCRVCVLRLVQMFLLPLCVIWAAASNCKGADTGTTLCKRSSVGRRGRLILQGFLPGCQGQLCVLLTHVAPDWLEAAVRRAPGQHTQPRQTLTASAQRRAATATARP